MKIKLPKSASDLSPPFAIANLISHSFKTIKIMMKKSILLLGISCAFYNHAICQITQGNWLVGGSGEFQKQREDLQGSDIRGLSISASP